MSDSQAASRSRRFISQKIAACWTAQQIESALVANYGQQILAAPSHKGFDLLAWWLPIAGRARAARSCSRSASGAGAGGESPTSRAEPAGSGLDEETERRLDELLARFD